MANPKKTKKKSLEDLKDSIEDLIDRDEDEPTLLGPYAHNIIACTLRKIHRDYGKEAAKETMVDAGLNFLGWTIPT